VILFIEHWIGYTWLALFIIWVLAGVLSKRTAQAQTGTSRLFQAGLAFIGLMLIFNFNNWFVSGWLTSRITPREAPYVLGGAILTIAGILFSLWARAILGSNWSAAVTIKENHTLVRRGPYQIVRHPIYTGFLLGLLGTSFVYGFARCFIGVLVTGSGILAQVADRRAIYGAALRPAISGIPPAGACAHSLRFVTAAVT